MSLKTFPKFPLLSTLAVAAVFGSAAAACSSSSSPPASTPPAVDAGTPMPFQADSPYVYVAKVKNLLVGLPPTDDEIQQVDADPSQLGHAHRRLDAAAGVHDEDAAFLRAGVPADADHRRRLRRQAYPRQIAANQRPAGLLLQNVQESFARTVLELVAQNQPLTQAITTHQLMMTPALMELYAFLDTWEVDDDSNTTDYWRKANPNAVITVEASQGAIPISETLDPTSPNYMHWYDPDVGGKADSTIEGCDADPIVFSGNEASSSTLHYLLYGTIPGRTGTGGVKCTQYGGSAHRRSSRRPTSTTGRW